MKQKAYFKINSKKLVLDETLVDFNGIPLFFTCKDEEEQFYIVLCYDIDEEAYIVTKTNVDKLLNLLMQNITMRDLILSEKEFWEVHIAENIEDDVCTKKNISEIDLDVLPYPNEYFEITTDAHQVYLSKLKTYQQFLLDYCDTHYVHQDINELDICGTLCKIHLKNYIEFQKIIKELKSPCFTLPDVSHVNKQSIANIQYYITSHCNISDIILHKKAYVDSVFYLAV